MNKVILIGRVGKDPEIKTTPNETLVCKFSMATSEGKDRTEWHNIVCFNKTADLVQKYVKKGDMVALEGSNHTNKWQDKDGNNRYSMEVLAKRVEFLSPKKSGSQSQPENQAPNVEPEDVSQDDDSSLPF